MTFAAKPPANYPAEPGGPLLGGATLEPSAPDNPLSDANAPLAVGRSVLRAGAKTLARLADNLDPAFERAVEAIIRDSGGRSNNTVTTGIGKAGHIATKVSATLASTGTPSFFLHPTEALHGDLGRVGQGDTVLLFSNSGGSQELLQLIPPLRGIGATLIAITANAASALSRDCDVVIPFGPCPEAGPLGLAPTTSTTVMLALGDALAMAVLAQRGFSPAEFARFHPGGTLGRSLLRVEDVMRRGDANPVVSAEKTVQEVLHHMSSTPGRPGATALADQNGSLVGFFTDGDFRRLIDSAVAAQDFTFMQDPIREHMTQNPQSTTGDRLVSEAMRVLRERRIDQIPVVDADNRPVGLLDVQDLLDIKALS